MDREKKDRRLFQGRNSTVRIKRVTGVISLYGGFGELHPHTDGAKISEIAPEASATGWIAR
jgi:hypothetical protein